MLEWFAVQVTWPRTEEKAWCRRRGREYDPPIVPRLLGHCVGPKAERGRRMETGSRARLVLLVGAPLLLLGTAASMEGG